jgi:hypothetical protein
MQIAVELLGLSCGAEYYVTLEVFVVVTVKFAVLWIMMPCSWWKCINLSQEHATPIFWLP